MNLIDLKQAPIVDKAQEGATLFALNTDGTVERISAENVGGSGAKVAKLKIDLGDVSSASLMNLMQGTATVDAADGGKAQNAAYTATCDNMTFEEAKAIVLAGEKLDCVAEAQMSDIIVQLYPIMSGGEYLDVEATEQQPKSQAAAVTPSVGWVVCFAGSYIVVSWTADGFTVTLNG